jgi:hypothetical protein
LLHDDAYLKSFAPFEETSGETELRDKIEITIQTKRKNAEEYKLNIARSTTFGELKEIVKQLFDGYELGTLYIAGKADKRPLKDAERPWGRLFASG